MLYCFTAAAFGQAMERSVSDQVVFSCRGHVSCPSIKCVYMTPAETTKKQSIGASRPQMAGLVSSWVNLAVKRGNIS